MSTEKSRVTSTVHLRFSRRHCKPGERSCCAHKAHEL